MNRKGARSLKVGMRVMWNNDPRDLGTVRGVGRDAVSIRWDVDTSTDRVSTLHVDDMALVSPAPPHVRDADCAAAGTVDADGDCTSCGVVASDCGSCAGCRFHEDDCPESDETTFETHRMLDPHCTCNDCMTHFASIQETAP